MKRVFAIVAALICVVSVFPNDSSATQASRDGFRDVKWGDSLEKHPELRKVGGADGDFFHYSKADDKLEIGEAKLQSIKYLFYNDRAAGVGIDFEGERNFSELKSALSERYGKPLQPNKYIEEYGWAPMDGVFMTINFYSVSKSGRYVMVKVSVLSEIESDKQKRGRDAAKDF